MRVEQRMLHRQNTPQGTFTILPTEVANLPTETGSGVCRTPPHIPLSARPAHRTNFHRTKYFFGQTFRQQAKISTIFPIFA